jgi:tungstate transport system substrate-binding protein
MRSRRQLLLAALPAGLSLSAHAQQRKSLADPLRLGVDVALFDAGLAQSLQRAFGRDTGLAVQLVRQPVLPMLEALDRGELDAALSNAPQVDGRLDKEGLVHDRRPIASSDFILVGPAPRPRETDPIGLNGARTAAEAFGLLRSAAWAQPGSLSFLTTADGSGVHQVEQAIWRRAGIAPESPWYTTVRPDRELIARARSTGAYALVERGAWLAQGGAPLAVRFEGDPELRESVHVMRAFRVSHPAGKIFVAWVGGPKGRRVVAAQRGYRSMPA